VQPAPAGGRAKQAALESLQGRIAEDGADDGTVVSPRLLGGRLISAGWKHWDDASLIGFAKVGMQRRRYRAERGWVNSVARPLKLNAFEAVRRLIHLKEKHHRYPAEGLQG
jgi:hypothetical protein